MTEEVCDELGLNEIFALKASSLTEYFTSDENVIAYRQSVIRDLMSVPELLETLSGIHPILDDIRELRRLDNENVSSAESYLYSITEIELYVSCLDTLRSGFKGVGDKIKSPAFLALSDFVCELTESDYYRELNEKLEAIAEAQKANRESYAEGEKRLAELNAKRAAVEEGSNEFEKKLADVNAKMREKMAQKELIFREHTKCENRLENLRLEQDKLATKLWDDYELTRADAVSLGYEAITAENRAGVAAKQIEYRNKLRAIGNVDLDAVNKYKEVKER